jgi:hypothetical protein
MKNSIEERKILVRSIIIVVSSLGAIGKGTFEKLSRIVTQKTNVSLICKRLAITSIKGSRMILMKRNGDISYYISMEDRIKQQNYGTYIDRMWKHGIEMHTEAAEQEELKKIGHEILMEEVTDEKYASENGHMNDDY